MTEPKASSRKTTGAKKPAQKPAARTASKKPTARWIRNLHNSPVHLRLATPEAERPFFVNLQPRGLIGDAERIPPAATDSRQFIDAVRGGLVEIVTQTELDQIEYPPVGYTQTQHIVVREADRDLSRVPDWDGKGRPPQHAPNNAQRPLTDRFLQGSVDVQGVAGAEVRPKTIREDRRVSADDMLPEGAEIFEDKPGARKDPTKRRVVVERVKG